MKKPSRFSAYLGATSLVIAALGIALIIPKLDLDVNVSEVSHFLITATVGIIASFTFEIFIKTWNTQNPLNEFEKKRMELKLIQSRNWVSLQELIKQSYTKYSFDNKWIGVSFIEKDKAQANIVQETLGKYGFNVVKMQADSRLDSEPIIGDNISENQDDETSLMKTIHQFVIILSTNSIFDETIQSLIHRSNKFRIQIFYIVIDDNVKFPTIASNMHLFNGVTNIQEATQNVADTIMTNDETAKT